MATYQCGVCLGEYTDPQADGSRYFHACPPLRNPDYEAQFEVDKDGNRVPKGPLNPKIPRFIPRDGARNENVERKPDGKMTAKENGAGRDTIEEGTPVKLRSILLAIALLWGNFLTPAHAQQVYNVCATFTGVDTTITTTAETVVATSEACKMPGRPVKLIVRVYGVVTTSADSATYKVRVRRTNVSGTALGDAIAQTVLVTAGGTEPFVFTATDERTGDLASVTYVATLEIASASSTSTVGQAYIEVMILG